MNDDAGAESSADSIAGRVMGAFSTSFAPNRLEMTVEVSVGVSVGPARWTSQTVDSRHLLAEADDALYSAKGLGKRRCGVSSGEIPAGAQSVTSTNTSTEMAAPTDD